MQLIKNVGSDRVLDHLQSNMASDGAMDAATDGLSLFAFEALKAQLDKAGATRLLLSSDKAKAQPRQKLDQAELLLPVGDPLAGGLLGDEHDRERRNALQLRGLANELLLWLEQKTQVRMAPGKLPQSALITDSPAGAVTGESAGERGVAITGDCPLTTRGLGLSPGNQFSLIQCSETEGERQKFVQWFQATWEAVNDDPDAKQRLVERVRQLAEHHAPSTIYFGVLYNLFKDLGDELDEERIVKSATGIRNTHVCETSLHTWRR
jgi:hypothetical protein